MNREFPSTSEHPVFQIRSSCVQFPCFSIFVRLDFSTTSVFSMPLNISPPLASTIPPIAKGQNW